MAIPVGGQFTMALRTSRDLSDFDPICASPNADGLEVLENGGIVE